MNRYCFVVLILLVFKAAATHIVGGDLTITQQKKGSNKFLISLTILFDQVNGNPNAEVDIINVAAFDKTTHTLLQNFYLQKVSNTQYLKYSDTACTSVKVRTRIITYALSVNLNKFLYNKPVYLAMENCCRNGTLQNIENPSATGSVFYAEFPAIWQNDIIVDNSSPVFTNLKGDYACKGRTLYLDFSASDTDGDSLSYELCTPLAGSSTSSNPLPNPIGSAPYSFIQWKPSCDSLSLPNGGFVHIHSKNGVVDFLSNENGLYVVTVKCSEYRQGKKIGEVRRDYQVFVQDCPPATIPKLSFLAQSRVLKDSSEVMDINNNYKKLTFFAQDSATELSFEAYPLNFNANYTFEYSPKFVKNYLDSAFSYFTWKDCSFSDTNKVNKVRIVVKNKTCPQAQKDTFLLKFKVNLPANQPPVIYPSVYSIEKNLYVNHSDTLFFTTVHTDSALIRLDSFRVYLADFSNNNISGKSVKFQNLNKINTINSETIFTSLCEQYPENQNVKFTLIAEESYCNQQLYDTIHITYHVLDHTYHPDSLHLVNIFTPNNDGYNDTFILKGLPPDRCYDNFETAQVFNRWGVKIFETKDRAINWEGTNAEAGTYFYLVKYQKSQFKGFVELRK